MTPKVHHKDVPGWAITVTEQPRSYLDFLGEPTITPADGKGAITTEDHFLRSQFVAALDGDQQALEWLLKRTIKELKSDLLTAEPKARAVIRGIPRVASLLPAMTALGCVTPVVHGTRVAAVRPSEWFRASLSSRCDPDRLTPVLEWFDAGGLQQPAIPESDLWD